MALNANLKPPPLSLPVYLRYLSLSFGVSHSSVILVARGLSLSLSRSHLFDNIFPYFYPKAVL